MLQHDKLVSAHCEVKDITNSDGFSDLVKD